MQDDGGSVATGSIRDEVVEVALQGPHEALVTRKDLGGEAAVATPLNLLQIGGLEAGLRIPQVNVVLALVAEEQGGAPVGAQENCLFTVARRASSPIPTTARSTTCATSWAPLWWPLLWIVGMTGPSTRGRVSAP